MIRRFRKVVRRIRWRQAALWAWDVLETGHRVWRNDSTVTQEAKRKAKSSVND